MHSQPEQIHRYDDMFSLPRHRSLSRLPMPRTGRAAQFAPFSALHGHGAAIRETARLTEEQVEPDEEYAEQLDRKLQLLRSHLPDHPLVTVTYFEPDEKKSGGSYITVSGMLVKLISITSLLLAEHCVPIPIRQIRALESPLFDLLENTE